MRLTATKTHWQAIAEVLEPMVGRKRGDELATVLLPVVNRLVKEARDG